MHNKLSLQIQYTVSSWNTCTFELLLKSYPPKITKPIKRFYTSARELNLCVPVNLNVSHHSNSFLHFQKPYACQVTGCGKRYTDPSSLRKHVKNHSEPTTPLSNLSLTTDSKISASIPSNSTSASRHDLISTTARQPQQQQPQTTAMAYAGESNYRSYKTSESYGDEDADLFQANLCQVDRISMSLDSNQEYIPFESVKRFLVDDVSNSHVDGTGKENTIFG